MSQALTLALGVAHKTATIFHKAVAFSIESVALAGRVVFGLLVIPITFLIPFAFFSNDAALLTSVGLFFLVYLAYNCPLYCDWYREHKEAKAAWGKQQAELQSGIYKGGAK